MESTGPKSSRLMADKSSHRRRAVQSALSKHALVWTTIVAAAGCTASEVEKYRPQPARGERDAGSVQTPDASSPIDRDSAVALGDSDGQIDSSEPSPVLGPCDNTTPETCPTSGCASGSACVPGVCGGSVCLEGRTCAADADCGAGRCEVTQGRCQPSLDACSDSRDCALGFECESDTCVDRRITCWSATRRDCPLGYFCVTPENPGFCLRIYEPCTDSTQCPLGGACVDVDADGQRECVPTGPCASGKTCEEGEGCGFDPTMGGKEADCSPHYLCHLDQDCGSEAPVCVDGAGDGQGLCAPPKGTCRSNEDCPSPAVCAMESPGAVPTCLGGGNR